MVGLASGFLKVPVRVTRRQTIDIHFGEEHRAFKHKIEHSVCFWGEKNEKKNPYTF